MDAVGTPDDDAAIAGIDAALAAGADFVSESVQPVFFSTDRPTTRVIEHLLARGASITAEHDGDCPFTAFHDAASSGRIDVVRVLLAHGGRDVIDQFDWINGTPLAYAARNGHLEIVRLLLDAGASVDARRDTHAQDSPLALAIMHGHLDIATLLVSRGADPDAKGWMSPTPRHRAEKAGEAFVRLLPPSTHPRNAHG